MSAKLINRTLFEAGEEVPLFSDGDAAISWLESGAEADNPVASNALGILYREGVVVEKSYEKAANLFLKAARKGHASAMYRIGRCYVDGTGVERSYEEAVDYFEESAELGYAKSQFWLGNMYYDGKGVPRSLPDAQEWYAKAADQGEEGAKLMLKVIHAWKLLNYCDSRSVEEEDVSERGPEQSLEEVRSQRIRRR